VIELFLVRSVSLVISDRIDKTGQTNSERHKWGYANTGSGGARSFRSIEAPTPTPTPPTPLLSSECPSSNSTNIRGQTTQRSVSIKDKFLLHRYTRYDLIVKKTRITCHFVIDIRITLYQYFFEKNEILNFTFSFCKMYIINLERHNDIKLYYKFTDNCNSDLIL